MPPNYAVEESRRNRRPVPEVLLQREKYLNTRAPKSVLLSAYDSVLEEMDQRFRSYQPETGEGVSKQRIAEWLLQFGHEDIPFAVRVLEHVRFWDRAALMDAFSIGLDLIGNDVLDAQSGTAWRSNDQHAPSELSYARSDEVGKVSGNPFWGVPMTCKMARK